MSGSGKQLGHVDKRINLYLDDLLDANERAQFEADLESDADLRRRFHQYRAIESSLQRQFEPPSATKLVSAIDTAENGTYSCERGGFKRRDTDDNGGGHAGGWSRPVYRRFAIAASFAAILVGGWLVVRSLSPMWRSPDTYMEHRTLAAAYEHAVKTGYKPDWVCENDQQFVSAFLSRFHQPLLLGSVTDGEAVGLAYGNTISRRTIYVLGKVKERPVMVFVDRSSADHDYQLPESSDLHLFRRELGRLVLYELTPWEEPAFLHAFHIPDDVKSLHSDDSQQGD